MYWYYKYSLILVAALILLLVAKCALPKSLSSPPKEGRDPVTDVAPVSKAALPPPQPGRSLPPGSVSDNADALALARQFKMIFTEADGARQAGRNDAAVELGLKALALPGLEPYSSAWRQAAALVGECNTRLFTSDAPSLRKASVTVKSGDALANFASRKTTVRAIQRQNKIPLTSRNIRAGQQLKFFDGPWKLSVYKKDYIMVLEHKGQLFKFYDVGLGKDNRTPAGEFVIKGKQENPPYYHPDGRVIPFGKPENIIGTRWMRLVKKADGSYDRIGIHGTSDPDSVGKASSAGCVRMRNSDVEELYDLLPDSSVEVIIKE
ncbi:MAG: hypothetical protein RL095_2200 [Verrucomicrobiota bacterium]|jgi:lipoprotein-anchoring transpeptidase ErfK/SrfK